MVLRNSSPASFDFRLPFAAWALKIRYKAPKPSRQKYHLWISAQFRVHASGGNAQIPRADGIYLIGQIAVLLAGRRTQIPARLMSTIRPVHATGIVLWHPIRDIHLVNIRRHPALLYQASGKSASHLPLCPHCPYSLCLRQRLPILLVLRAKCQALWPGRISSLRFCGAKCEPSGRAGFFLLGFTEQNAEPSG